MRAHIIGLCLAAASLGACSGGGGGGSSVPGGSSGSGGSGSQSTARTTNEQAVAVTDGVGTPLKSFASYSESFSTSLSPSSSTRFAQSATAIGTCVSGVEFFAPDTAGDANSSETKVFYDSGCTQLARDTVRIYSATSSSSESVTRNTALYAPGSSTPSATRTTTNSFANATFDQYGFPIAADGFTRSETSQLNIAGAKTIVSGGELVMQASSTGTNAFCDDTAGYNATGSSTLDETFGWSGGVPTGGTVAHGSNGSYTYTATHAGTAYKGPIGGLSLAVGVPNTTCPIATPAFTLAGGTAIGTYSIPIVATFAYGALQSLSVTNATLADGNTLSIATTAGATPASANFAIGTIANAGTTVATFAVDAFGDGTLTVAKTGAQFLITDWHVIR